MLTSQHWFLLLCLVILTEHGHTTRADRWLFDVISLHTWIQTGSGDVDYRMHFYWQQLYSLC